MDRKPPAVSDAAARDGSVKSVQRSIDILLAFVDRPMTLTEMSQRTGLSKTTTLRLLTTLVHRGMVLRDPLNNAYQLGPGCLRLGQAFVSGKGGFEALARGALRELREQSGETVTVHVRVGSQRVCVDELPSAEGVRYVAEVGTTAPVYVGAAGRVLLAAMPPADVLVLLSGVPLSTPATGEPVDLARLAKDLDIVRRQGFAMSEGERMPGAAAVSVPVQGSGGMVAALSILGPAMRLTRRKRLECVEQLKLAANHMGSSLQGVSGA